MTTTTTHWQPSLHHAPLRILDATGMQEDYYTQQLSWSGDWVATALAQEVLVFRVTDDFFASPEGDESKPSQEEKGEGETSATPSTPRDSEPTRDNNTPPRTAATTATSPSSLLEALQQRTPHSAAKDPSDAAACHAERKGAAGRTTKAVWRFALPGTHSDISERSKKNSNVPVVQRGDDVQEEEEEGSSSSSPVRSLHFLDEGGGEANGTLANLSLLQKARLSPHNRVTAVALRSHTTATMDATLSPFDLIVGDLFGNIFWVGAAPPTATGSEEDDAAGILEVQDVISLVNASGLGPAEVSLPPLTTTNGTEERRCQQDRLDPAVASISQSVTCVSFSPTSPQLIAVGCSDGFVHLLHLCAASSGSSRCSGSATTPTLSLSLSRPIWNGETSARQETNFNETTAEGPIKCRPPPSFLRNQQGPIDDRICAVAFNCTGSFLAVGTSSHGVQVWSRANQLDTPLCVLQPSASSFGSSGAYCSIRGLDFHPTNPFELATGAGMGDGTIRVYNLAFPQHAHLEVCEVATGAQVCQLRYSPCGNYLLSSQGFRPTQLAKVVMPQLMQQQQRPSVGVVDPRAALPWAQPQEAGEDRQRRVANPPQKLDRYCIDIWKRGALSLPTNSTSSYLHPSGVQLRSTVNITPSVSKKESCSPQSPAAAHLPSCASSNGTLNAVGSVVHHHLRPSSPHQRMILTRVVQLECHSSRPLHMVLQPPSDSPFSSSSSSSVMRNSARGGVVLTAAGGTDATLRFWKLLEPATEPQLSSARGPTQQQAPMMVGNPGGESNLLEDWALMSAPLR